MLLTSFAPDLHLGILAEERDHVGPFESVIYDVNLLANTHHCKHYPNKTLITISHHIIPIFKICDINTREKIRILHALGHGKLVTEFIQSTTKIWDIKSDKERLEPCG